MPIFELCLGTVGVIVDSDILRGYDHTGMKRFWFSINSVPEKKKTPCRAETLKSGAFPPSPLLQPPLADIQYVVCSSPPLCIHLTRRR